MYDSNREAAIEFVRGATTVVGAVVVAVLFIFAVGVTLSEIPEGKPAEKFKVVVHYGTCAVVQYTPPQRAESVYFLDCGNQHLEQVR